MTIKEFADRCMEHKPTICYIAVMLCDEQFDLEVELPGHNIAGCYRTGIKNTKMGLIRARNAADQLAAEFRLRSVKVAEQIEQLNVDEPDINDTAG